MGYKLPSNKVTFELAGYEGAEITATLAADIEAFYAVQGIQGAMADVSEVGIQQVRDIVTYFVEHIATGWNLEDDSGPIPLTPERMLKLPVGILMAIITGWQQAVAGIAAPLVETSLSGDTSLVEPEATEPE